ncbi:MAG: alpha-E domain-containing protein [Pseudonocardia sp.]|nr:alpha-E domain-containing protein [Pseudonocardia sp.]
MLLARIAESLYWAGRYLERAEDTARMITVHTDLLRDLPLAAGVGWTPLLAVTGCSEEFLDRHTCPEEDDVVGFLATDPKNRGSILSSLAHARANLRASRVVLPNSSWEVANHLHGWAAGSANDARDRGTRPGWMQVVIFGCQLLGGSLAGTMCHDEAYGFLQLGRHIERADMTIRVLGVQAGVLVGQPPAGVAADYRDVTWASVLRSLCAHQTFSRTEGGGISGPAALRFLLQDQRFPRSVRFCVASAGRKASQLPTPEPVVAQCTAAQDRLDGLVITELTTPNELNDLADKVELDIGEIHEALASTYFTPVLEETA